MLSAGSAPLALPPAPALPHGATCTPVLGAALPFCCSTLQAAQSVLSVLPLDV